MTTMLRIVLVLGTIAAVPSVILSLQSGLPGIAILDTIAIAWVAIVALRTDIPYRVRAWSVVIIAYGLGVVFLVTIGTSGQVYLMAVPALTALLIGLRPALLALLVSTLTLFSVAFLADAGLAVRGLEDQPVLRWGVIALNFGFVSAIITGSTGVLLDRLEPLSTLS
ncbi:MAG: hypothetical protein ABIP77_04175 [Candidatus Limnocylindrales bacterium]